MENPTSDIIVKALFLLAWVICGFAVINYKQIRRLRNVAAHFRGSLTPYSLFLPTVKGRYENLRFSLHAGPQFLEIHGTLKIRLFVRPQITFRICRRSLFARAAGTLRLLPEVQTGDPLFDAEFTVFAHETVAVRSYLQQAGVRQALQALLHHGFWMLVFDRHGGWAEKLAYDREHDLEPARVATLLQYLKLAAVGV